LRREPELPDHVAIVKETTPSRRDANEFAFIDDTPEHAARQQEIIRRRMGGLARQGAMDPADGLDL
jgi:type IV secretion system protein VirD4